VVTSRSATSASSTSSAASILRPAWAAGAGPGDAPMTIDMASTVCEVHGYAKQSAAYGYTRPSRVSTLRSGNRTYVDEQRAQRPVEVGTHDRQPTALPVQPRLPCPSCRSSPAKAGRPGQPPCFRTRRSARARSPGRVRWRTGHRGRHDRREGGRCGRRSPAARARSAHRGGAAERQRARA
jgi:hypothetical protein